MYSFYFAKNCDHFETMNDEQLQLARKHYRKTDSNFPMYVREFYESFDEKWKNHVLVFVGGIKLTGRGSTRTMAARQVIEFLTHLGYHRHENNACVEDIVTEGDNISVRNIRFGKNGIDKAVEMFVK